MIPKVGPFKAVNFKIPTQQTEDMYIKSVNETVENYTHLAAARYTTQNLICPTAIATPDAKLAPENMP